MNSGTGAHPHRGIATLSYILEGEDEHFDSAGNYAKVYSGGIQWMKAGNGIIHDETINVDSTTELTAYMVFNSGLIFLQKQSGKTGISGYSEQRSPSESIAR
jgi:redox-sensitive bicupin YhaK (pirin superfamily)